MQGVEIEELARKVIDLLQINQIKEAITIAKQVTAALRETGQNERADLIEARIAQYEKECHGG